MTIVRVTPSVGQTCVMLSDQMRGMPFICQDLFVQITRVGSRTGPLRGFWNHLCDHILSCERDPRQQFGTRHGISDCDNRDATVLEYQAHSIDDTGRVCFHWDDLLYQQRPGRYDATIVDRARNVIAQFQIELLHTIYVVSDPANRDNVPNCEACE